MFRAPFAVLIAVLCAACGLSACATSGTLVGSAWLAERVDGASAEGAQSTLEFLDSGRAAGRGGCNRYSGQLVLGEGSIRIGEVISTKMACAAPLMDQEERFLKALEAARGWRIEDDRLLLLDGAGRVIVTLSRLEPAGP